MAPLCMKLRLTIVTLAGAAALAACGSSHGLTTADAPRGGDSGGSAGSDARAVDAPGTDAGPDGVDCFYDGTSLGTCGPPVITAAYLTTDCQATSGVFIVGHG